MNKDQKQLQNQDEVDEIVEALVADPTRANDVKALLRRKIAAPGVVQLVVPSKEGQKSVVIEEDSDDDVWDNMPV
ncbi:MAG: hypothetical protein ACR2O1_02790 [Boseongicola sp.]